MPPPFPHIEGGREGAFLNAFIRFSRACPERIMYRIRAPHDRPKVDRNFKSFYFGAYFAPATGTQSGYRAADLYRWANLGRP
jgi:hypothetical protein